ncbi:hypothetical protein PQD71_gp212 [Kosakonia phage Kc263]|uniref:Uncharacterized protein n=1 Tax=Kosakonia phage Kc263 TaxID=2863194 RepID=A0AAE7WFE9_9CAUD|nr:hypothetical protein PQD71_gp212 [Kosakonia phage Kc263]QYN80114.1 hypothetical protein [Kosakonia phage Kc263]
MNENKKARPVIKNKNFVPYEQLTDTTSRLFRKIIEELGINQATWKTYLDDYLRWIHPDDSAPAAEVKRARSTDLGNIQNTLFCSRTLSYNKFLMGLKILKISETDLTIAVKTESGVTHTVFEKTILRKPSRKTEED